MSPQPLTTPGVLLEIDQAVGELQTVLTRTRRVIREAMADQPDPTEEGDETDGNDD